jgi:hypothetical protein
MLARRSLATTIKDTGARARYNLRQAILEDLVKI